MATQSPDHLLDDMVGTDAQATAQHLNRKVSIAEMPGNPHQFAALVRKNLQQFLWFRTDAHDGAIWQGKAISVAKMHGVRHIQLHFGAMRASQNDSTAVAVVMVQQYMVDLARGLPGASGEDAFRSHQNRK